MPRPKTGKPRPPQGNRGQAQLPLPGPKPPPPGTFLSGTGPNPNHGRPEDDLGPLDPKDLPPDPITEIQEGLAEEYGALSLEDVASQQAADRAKYSRKKTSRTSTPQHLHSLMPRPPSLETLLKQVPASATAPPGSPEEAQSARASASRRRPSPPRPRPQTHRPYEPPEEDPLFATDVAAEEMATSDDAPQERDPRLEAILDQVLRFFARNRTEKHWRVLLATTYSLKWHRWAPDARNVWLIHMETLLADEDRLYSIVTALDDIAMDPMPDWRYARMAFQLLAWEAFTTCFLFSETD
jgi:hypothetical protein